MRDLISSYKLNKDAGYSLVELIVAVGIGVIVAGSISALIAFSVRMYSNESANAQAQNELQTSLNQVMDAIMSSQGAVIVQNASGEGAYTSFAGFGSFEKASESGPVTFKGVVLVAGPVLDASTGRFNIYMNRELTGSTAANEYLAVRKVVENIKQNFSTNPNPYLLSQNATEFKLDFQKDSSGKYIALDTVKKKYVNPLEISVEMNFERVGFKTINKHVKDDVYMRNAVKSNIYLGDSVTAVDSKYDIADETTSLYTKSK